MRSVRMAKDYAERAMWVLREAEQAFDATNPPLVHLTSYWRTRKA